MSKSDPKTSPCCALSRMGVATRPARGKKRRARARRAAPSAQGMVDLPGDRFWMGTDAADGFPDDGEGPIHEVRLGPFLVDACAVTNAQFAGFVKQTSYVTDAERYGWSFVFHLLLPDDFPPTRGVACAPWWRQVEGARWSRPEGPGSSLRDRGDHPVVHVSWNDATQYARWAGKRLPTEAEWEYAARGGLVQARFPWGDELTPEGMHRCNIWQGTFPVENTLDDGYLGTAPARSYPPNGFGLYNSSGNVWEWCSDWFSAESYQSNERLDPKGPRDGTARVIRGGSYLCHESYCNRYRVAARSSSTPDSSTGNMGFRCVGAVSKR